MPYKIELANLNNLDAILKLYSERIEWFRENSIKQWSAYEKNHPKIEFIEAINQRSYYILKKDNEIIAGFELSTDSRLWNDKTTDAYYIYKVVTKVGYKNIGKQLFAKCIEIAKEDNKKYLRLDCLRMNKKLNKIYEQHNFRLIRYGQKKNYKYALREMRIHE